MYDNNMIMSLKQKKRKFEPRMKLNHNSYFKLFDRYRSANYYSQTSVCNRTRVDCMKCLNTFCRKETNQGKMMHYQIYFRLS